jgi:putative tricarboxylic transport membrane protein
VKFTQRVLLAGLVIGATMGAAHAWEVTGPVEIVVAAGPGGGNDKTARLIAKVLYEKGLVSAPIVVINKPGAGGVIAQKYLNSREGNGHYLMVTNPAIITNPITGIGDVSYKEVTPLAQLFTEYVVLLAAAKSSKVESIHNVLDSWKKDPGELTLGVAPALAAGTHIGIAQAAMVADIDPNALRIIPFSTSGDVMNSLVGGHIDMMASTPINVLPQVGDGLIKPLAITAPERLGGALADVPTFKELGIDSVFGNWRGIVGPKGLSSEQIEYWDEIFTRLMDLPEWKKEVQEQQSVEMYLASEASKKFLEEEDRNLTHTLKQLGFSKQ